MTQLELLVVHWLTAVDGLADSPGFDHLRETKKMTGSNFVELALAKSFSWFGKF
jgi:hypothetical protein